MKFMKLGSRPDTFYTSEAKRIQLTTPRRKKHEGNLRDISILDWGCDKLNKTLSSHLEFGKTKTAFCKGVIAGFGKNGWWYRCCPVNKCYKQCFKKEDLNDKYTCKNKDHEVQAPIPRFRVNTIIEDQVSDKTVCFMGKPAEQFFGSDLQSLLGKRHYTTEEALPEEILATIGQEHIFELRGNKYGDWNVVGTQAQITAPTTMVSTAEPASKAPAESFTDIPEPALETPQKLTTLRKRGSDTVLRELFPTIDEKKTKRNAGKSTPSSSAMEQKDKKD